MEDGPMHLIVGIDPGKTSAIACLDLNGRLVHSAHRANAGLAWIVSSIRMVGTPSIIATDKRRGTETVKKVNAYFNSRIYSPPEDIGKEQKLDASRRSSLKDRHERDAYAAAESAYRAFRNKLLQAEHIARQSSVAAADLDRIKAKVLDRYSIDEAIHDKKANRK